MSDLTMIWEEVINMLSLDMNDVQLQNWIVPLTPLSLTNDTLVLDTKTQFIHSMVEKKYLKNIQICIGYLCQKPIDVILSNTENMSSSQTPLQNVVSKTTYPEKTKQTQVRDIENEDIVNQIREKQEIEQKYRSQNGYETLNPKYTMKSFVTGPSNEFAVAAAKGVIRNPGTNYNPFFIYGGSGLGKTHLMQAIAHEILNDDPKKNVFYITSEKFMNEMIAMIENGANTEKERFRKKYRSIDVLLIDDIQFIAGKKATMEEIFHTFNDLKEANKQIVLSSDKPPRELTNLEERLVTRFEGGMTADIQSPDFETRVAILNHKLRNETMEFPSYVLEYIANHVTASIRELEGALLKVIAFFRFKRINPIESTSQEALTLTREALKLKEKKDVVITIDDIILLTLQEYNLDKRDLFSGSRQSSIVIPRQVAMYIARKLTNLSLVSIGEKFHRDHSTVMHAVDKIESQLKMDRELQQKIEQLIAALKKQ